MKHIDELVRCEERPILNNEQDDAALVAGVLTTLTWTRQEKIQGRIEKEFGGSEESRSFINNILGSLTTDPNFYTGCKLLPF